ARPAVSIVIPVHNKATITRNCLVALLAETDDGIDREVIVVDDGSSDSTMAMLASYGNQLTVLHNESARGFAGACNAGAAAATGEFLILLNNDTIPTAGWLAHLVTYAIDHPAAAVVGAKLLLPNDTIQHAGVVFGLGSEPHHIYTGFPADHPAVSVSRRFQVVTAACALFRRGPWDELGGLDTAFHNGWEDVDYCMRAGEAEYEVHYCAESVVYHLESATRDLLSDVERANRALFAERWREKVVSDDFTYYWADGLFSAHYGARFPIQLSVSPLLAGVTVGDDVRLADKLLHDRARQVMILLRNNIVLNVRVQEAEARAAEAERRLSQALATVGGGSQPAPDGNAPSSGESTTGQTEQPVGAGPLPDPKPAEQEAPASDSPQLPHRIVGIVESPGRLPDVVTDGYLVISGWALTAAGGTRVEAIVDGVSRGEIPSGAPRPDAAELSPGFPEGENCGFSSELPVGDLPDGMHELKIRISSASGEHAALSTMFEIDNHAYEKGRVIGRIDVPVRGTMCIPQEIINMSGWTLAPSGIRSIEAFLDGESFGRIGYGALRPDIGQRHRQYADADHCGFFGTVPLAGLEEGFRELVIVVTANDGQQLELPSRIEIEGGVFIDGGIPSINRHYPAWLERRGAALAQISDELGDGLATLSFAALVPLDDASPETLAAIASSLSAQTYATWRLVLVDGDNVAEETRLAARQIAESDRRMAYREPGDSASVGAALNAALAESDADWVTVVTPGMIFSPIAFASIARALADDPDARLVYTDDDRIDPDTTVRWNPFFKPDWSPDLLLSMNYLAPLALFHRQTTVAAGGIREGFPGAEMYDLALRVTELSRHVRHVPDVLATTIETTPDLGETWHVSEWRESERLALVDTLARRGIEGSVEAGLHPGTWRVKYALPDPPAVTAVIPTGGNLGFLRPCLDDLLQRTDYPKLDILLVDNSHGDDVARLVEELAPRYPNIRRIIDTRKPFNYSGLINDAIPHVSAPYVLMLNDDITVIEPDWLRAMIEQAQRPEVGIVGAKLLYPDNTIQHAGVILGPFGGSVHIFKRRPSDDPGFFNLANVVRNCSAVTFACAVIDRAVFDQIGGLDEVNLPVAFNDTDFCLRAREAGYEVIYTPHATLHHHESVTKTVIAHPHEIAYLRTRWGHVIAHDPYYNPNLTRQGEDARLDMVASSAA
ncbi:MAG: glycosyltransferase, partial [Chloroflexia bacterium]|nr:glycosyltransferase [Chloroflexia bacterium]